MAAQTKFILRAVGPTAKLMGVTSDSVSLEEVGGSVPLMTGRITPQTYIQITKSQRYRWTQNYINYGVIPTKVESFVFHWAPFDDTTLVVGATGLSVLSDVAVIPQSCTAAVSGQGEMRPATTTLEAFRLTAAPTWGTTVGTPPTDDHAFILGPSTFNGSAVNNLTSQTVNFGITADTNLGKSGSQVPVWPFAITAYGPEIVYETEDLGLVKDYVNGPLVLSSNAAACKFQNEGGTTGFVYTMSKAAVFGSIKNDIGTLRLRMLDGSTWTAAAY